MATDGSQPASNGIARSVVRTLLWPARRFFDPRFVGVHEAVQDVRRVVVADADAANEFATYMGRTLDTIQGRLDEQGEQLKQLNQLKSVDDRLATVDSRLDDLTRFVGFDPDEPHSTEEIDPHRAALLNFEAGHEGYAAQSGHWFNPPVLVGYETGKVEVRWVNERVVEVPYVFRALAGVEPGGKILDVGASESTLCLSLATLGYQVTAIDPRPNPLRHELLEVVEAPIEEWQHSGEFDAVVCLSTIEHIGVGAYEQDASDRRVDLEAMSRMRELTKPGGLLVVTTAVGPASVGELGRVYDREGLDELLEAWEVKDETLVQRRDATTWVTVDEDIASLDGSTETVAMVTAARVD
jgi:2-polyprenyl-3-methyl-5-hydroxy-6-metoxy-1,4-benzoquinol methylase